MSYYDFFKANLESQGKTLNFEDDEKFWIENFIKTWIEVAGLYFIHKQKKATPFINFASKYSSFDELLDELEGMNDDNFMLNIAGYLHVTLIRLAYAANDNKPWEVAFHAAEVPQIIQFMPAWQGLREAHWNELPIEEGKILSHEQIIRSDIAKQNAEKRHKENKQFKEEAIAYYEKNKSRFKSRAEAAREIMKIVPIKFRTADEWLSIYIKQQSASKP